MAGKPVATGWRTPYRGYERPPGRVCLSGMICTTIGRIPCGSGRSRLSNEAVKSSAKSRVCYERASERRTARMSNGPSACRQTLYNGRPSAKRCMFALTMSCMRLRSMSERPAMCGELSRFLSATEQGLAAESPVRWSDVFRPRIGEFKVYSAYYSEPPTVVIVTQYAVIIIPSPFLLPRLRRKASGPLRTGLPVPNLDRHFRPSPPAGPARSGAG